MKKKKLNNEQNKDNHICQIDEKHPVYTSALVHARRVYTVRYLIGRTNKCIRQRPRLQFVRRVSTIIFGVYPFTVTRTAKCGSAYKKTECSASGKRTRRGGAKTQRGAVVVPVRPDRIA